jgi:hypothetical protein
VRGGGGGEYNRECLFDNDCNGNKYDNNNKYSNAEDGKGLRGGADNGGESHYDGCDVVCGPSFGSVGIGRRLLAPTLPPPSSTTTMMTIAPVVGGRHAPPPLVHPVLPTLPIVVDDADQG